MTEQKTFADALRDAASLTNERGQDYGDLDLNFFRISTIASVVLGRQVTRYEVAAILHATKLGRIAECPEKYDSYPDGINYMAFMSHFKDEYVQQVRQDRLPPQETVEERNRRLEAAMNERIAKLNEVDDGLKKIISDLPTNAAMQRESEGK